jgi:hypothetical protein
VNATERRIRELQRVAYGADATDDERAVAIAELERLTTAPGSDAATDAAAADTDVAATTGSPAPRAADSAPAPPEGPASPSWRTPAVGTPAVGTPAVGIPGVAAARRRLVRWTAVAASAGLIVGGVLGWSTAQRVPSTSSSSSRFGIVSTPQPGVPLEDTRIPQLFDRLPLAAEAARIAGIDDAVDPASVRLVASRTDGPSAFLVRTLDGGDICLVLAFPTGPFQRECTSQGIFPIDGLSVQYGLDRYGLAVARLSSAGTVSLGLIVS